MAFKCNDNEIKKAFLQVARFDITIAILDLPIHDVMMKIANNKQIAGPQSFIAHFCYEKECFHI